MKTKDNLIGRMWEVIKTIHESNRDNQKMAQSILGSAIINEVNEIVKLKKK